MMWKLIKCFIASCLLVASAACHAATDDASQELLKSYDRAMSSYRNGDVFGAYEILDSFFDVHNYADFNPLFSRRKYAEILNDYAFFMEKYYEKKAANFCKSKGGTSTDFLTFRASILDDAKEVLKFVIELQPDRTPAYLNLADVLYELDWDEQAEGYYARYAELQQVLGRSIPKRVLDRSVRKKFYTCK